MMAEPGTTSDAPNSSRIGVVAPHAPTVRQRLLARLIYLVVRAVAATLRYEYRDESGLLGDEPPRPVIFAGWHNRLALALIVYEKYVHRRQPARRLAALASASRDGALVSRVLELFHVQPVRGSSSRRGLQALVELTAWSGRGYDLAITPDGPRGPRYEVQPGVLSLAQLTGQPIVPAAYNLSFKWCLKSWDGFQIPLPFSRCEVVIDAPVIVPRQATQEERDQLRAELSRRLAAITRD
jgi:hypothetical protein